MQKDTALWCRPELYAFVVVASATSSYCHYPKIGVDNSSHIDRPETDRHEPQLTLSEMDTVRTGPKCPSRRGVCF